MARPLRIEFHGAASHHLAWRQAGADFLRMTPVQAFVDVVMPALNRFDACALAFCPMDNYYHLVLPPRQPDLSASMGQIHGVYTHETKPQPLSL